MSLHNLKTLTDALVKRSQTKLVSSVSTLFSVFIIFACSKAEPLRSITV